MPELIDMSLVQCNLSILRTCRLPAMRYRQLRSYIFKNTENSPSQSVTTDKIQDFSGHVMEL